MKKELSRGVIIGTAVAAAALLTMAAILYFKPSFGPGPVVQPKPFTPPGGIPSAASANAPKGAPKSTN